jgi:NADPH-dependent 2,4-dienoyl-CoA reductase/sulfur reductase-like enzyme
MEFLMKHVILGNGPAGVIAAETIRQHQPSDEIILLGAEPEPPYSRMAIPYLLVGDIKEEGTYLRKTKSYFKNLNIQEVHGCAQHVNSAKKEVTLADGKKIGFDRLLIATGSHPVKPNIVGMDLPGVHSCWTLEDARAILQLAKPGARVLQMGAGFIGCIILEALASRGVNLTVVEMGNRMVPRMMTEGAGAMIKEWVQSKGVAVHTDTSVEAIALSNGSASASEASPLKVTLSNGTVIEVDLVISATGVKPNIEFLKDSGIEMNKGVLVDQQMQTSVPGIYAAGDVTESVDFSTGQRIVNAIQPNAAEQAKIAGANMAGAKAESQGALQINVLDTLGLISSSFGQWWGIEGQDHVELKDTKNFKYMRLEFHDDVLIGATSCGLTEHVGALRGLIQTRAPLGSWKEQLMKDPSKIMQAYLAKAQARAEWMG